VIKVIKSEKSDKSDKNKKATPTEEKLIKQIKYEGS
jgi:hypothetical protein